MSNYIKIATTAFIILCAQGGAAQPRGCTSQQKSVDGVQRCVEPSSDDVIALGTLMRAPIPGGGERVILHDEKRGDIDLKLTPSLVEVVDESPADSFEVEGYLSGIELTVKNLRPIE
ncbi:MAG: hypothetical protein H7249_14750 [Chitinophagaceae bacterium]|nr:hypothetical protein [Oligoflexus sp.]